MKVESSYVARKGVFLRRKASTRSVKFTMIGFRALTSDSVMCVLIFEGKKLNCAIKNDFNINMKTDMEQHLIHTL